MIDSFRLYEKNLSPYYEKTVLGYELNKDYALELREKYNVYGDTIELYEITEIFKNLNLENSFLNKRIFIVYVNGKKQGDTRPFYDLSHCIRQLYKAFYRSVENYNAKYFA